MFAVGALGNVLDINAIDVNPAAQGIVKIIEAQQKIHQRALTAAGMAHEPDHLSGLDVAIG